MILRGEGLVSTLGGASAVPSRSVHPEFDGLESSSAEVSDIRSSVSPLDTLNTPHCCSCKSYATYSSRRNVKIWELWTSFVPMLPNC